MNDKKKEIIAYLEKLAAELKKDNVSIEDGLINMNCETAAKIGHAGNVWIETKLTGRRTIYIELDIFDASRVPVLS